MYDVQGVWVGGGGEGGLGRGLGRGGGTKQADPIIGCLPSLPVDSAFRGIVSVLTGSQAKLLKMTLTKADLRGNRKH